jgi:hypothetical protein
MKPMTGGWNRFLEGVITPIRKPRPFSRTELNRTVQFLYSDPDDVSATGSKYFHC